MRPRHDLTELFSSFIQFHQDDFGHWVTDGTLRRSIGSCLKESGQDSDGFWALYWHRRWQEQAVDSTARATGLPLNHLLAYLQEPCYWVAKQTLRKISDSHFQVSDCFQVAIAHTHTVLRDFKADRGASLKTYSSMAFASLLRSDLRQRQEADLCTDLGLLRKVSKKRLMEALQAANLPPTTIQVCVQLWTCFKTLYVPTTSSKLPQADRPFWDRVADLHRQERSPSSSSNPRSGWTGDRIEQQLSQCARWIRAYLHPAVASLNVPRSEEGYELLDSLPDATLDDSLLSELIQQEEQQQRHSQQMQVQTVLVDALTKLDAQSQTLLKLYYQQGLTQQQMMDAMQMSQATVSRRLAKARTALLSAMVEWAQAIVNESPHPDLIKGMSTALEEWLMVHYSES
ncbi:MAG: sigma-70 family RNA polymerase sigma factor [Oculatellaceae cyanobacterium Prado106]|jgi:RNA polymerase sigma factor (sigma-70 family)|nr:sigma-70 family RNA polymerase sigma factor [Oculatellaceae cyanobacterium Prado106]